MKRIDTLIELISKIHTLLNRVLDSDTRCLVCQSQAQNEPQELEEWLSKEEVKAYLKISDTTYYRWVKEGKLEPRGVGEHRYFKSDLTAILQARKYRERGG